MAFDRPEMTQCAWLDVQIPWQTNPYPSRLTGRLKASAVTNFLVTNFHRPQLFTGLRRRVTRQRASAACPIKIWSMYTRSLDISVQGDIHMRSGKSICAAFLLRENFFHCCFSHSSGVAPSTHLQLDWRVCVFVCLFVRLFSFRSVPTGSHSHGGDVAVSVSHKPTELTHTFFFLLLLFLSLFLSIWPFQLYFIP